jgi:hypothetical protein
MISELQELRMRTLAAFVISLSVSFAQESAPARNRVEWNPSVPYATKKLPDGRTQRTVATKSAAVSVIADLVPARRFLDPPLDGGPDITYVVVGIRNSSRQAFNIDPATITLRVVGKKEKELKRFTEEQVVFRAWQRNDTNPCALPAMVGRASNAKPGSGMRSPDADATMQGAIAHKEQDKSNRIAQQKSEQQTSAQALALSDKAFFQRELAPGGSAMGMVFFYPYEKNDRLEISIPVSDTTFVIPFSGRKAKQ